MGNDLNSIYFGQLVSKQVIENEINAKSTPKTKSRIKAMVKKIVK